MGKVASSAVLAATLAFVVCFAPTPASATDQENLIHNFGADGPPQSGLIADAQGNLYGTASGHYGKCPPSCGEVFELKASTDGAFLYRVLHTFVEGNGDGIRPQGTLAFDAAGNLYGTTIYGGTGTGTNCSNGCGTVFELSPTSSGAWNETILHSFVNGSDGAFPNSGVILDSAGNIYGVTEGGGTAALDPVPVGTVFQLTPSSSGWSETILHAFTYNTTDGMDPWGIAMDATGNLWGVTPFGGTEHRGIVYELTKQGSSWAENTVYNFRSGGSDGYEAVGTLVFDSAGNVYGTSWIGGSSNEGIVFELTPSAGGGWSERILHTFTSTPDGGRPFSGLTFDDAGNLYGTTENGGAYSCGTVFEMSPQFGKGWNVSILHSFPLGASDGCFPMGNVIFGPRGQLFGTTYYGGAMASGTVYEILPSHSANARPAPAD